MQNNKKNALVVCNSGRSLIHFRLSTIKMLENKYNVYIIAKNDLIDDRIYQFSYSAKFNFLSIYRSINSISPNLILSYGLISNFYIFICKIFNFSIKYKWISFIPGIGTIYNISKPFRNYFIYIYGFIISRSDVLITSNELISRIFKNFHNKIISVPGEGVDINLWQNSQLNYNDNIIRLSFISRLLSSKGVSLFLNLSENNLNPNFQFLIAGSYDTSLRSFIFNIYLKRKIEYLVNIKKLKNYGDLSSIYDILTNTKWLLLPTTYGEGLPTVLMEAQSIGIPVVIYKKFWSYKYFIGFKNCLYINDFKSIEDLLYYIEKMSIEDYRTYSINSLNCSKNYFDRNNIVNILSENT